MSQHAPQLAAGPLPELPQRCRFDFRAQNKNQARSRQKGAPGLVGRRRLAAGAPSRGISEAKAA